LMTDGASPDRGLVLAQSGGVKTERWDGVPPMSEDYDTARDWLVERIGRLLERPRSEKCDCSRVF